MVFTQDLGIPGPALRMFSLNEVSLLYSVCLVDVA